MQVLREPVVSEALPWLQEAVAAVLPRRRSVLLVGSCRIKYEGRASSTLGHGERIVVIKGDGTLLVHNPVGVKPVNWQPAGATYSVGMSGEDVMLVARRKKPPETVRIRFSGFRLLSAGRLRDEGVFELKGSEFDLRDLLYHQPELVEAGFVPWTREKVSERGPMDLYGEDAQGRRVVVELKRTAAGIAEATQLWRYVEQERKKRGVDVRGILVAPTASARAQALLKDHGLEFHAVSWKDVKDVSPLRAASQATLGSYAKQTDNV